MRIVLFSLLVSFYFLSQSSWAGLNLKSESMDGAFLDPAYPVVVRPSLKIQKWHFFGELPSKSDTEKLIQMQTPVKSQGSRGTCSIFSATALLESLLNVKYKRQLSLDLSEEWLEYVTHFNATADGSTSYANFRAFAQYGTVREKLWLYIGQTWEDLASSADARDFCGSEDLAEDNLKKCLVAHQDPSFMEMTDENLKVKNLNFYNIRNEAFQFRDRYLVSLKKKAIQSVFAPDEIKSKLLSGIPMTLDLDFFYGAWNHRLASENGMARDMDYWQRGIVAYPEVGSRDREFAIIKPAGHSVVVVGYDDNIVVKAVSVMADGTLKTTEHKGVYYFKNSWGTDSFGLHFNVEGHNHPGYGMITQDYADEFGTFYQMLL